MSQEIFPNDSLIKCFSQAILTDKTKDVLFDFSEIGIDSLLEYLKSSDILKEIPFIKSLLATINITKSIIEIHNTQKLLIFLQQLQMGICDQKEIDKRKKAYQKGKEWYYREVEQTVIYLHRASRIEKAKIIAELYRNLINKDISTEEYGEYLDIVDQLFIQDIPHLLEIYDAQKATATLLNGKDFLDSDTGKNFSFQSIRCSRLKSIGLLKQYHPMSFGFSSDDHFALSKHGIYFCEIIHRIDNLNVKYEFKKAKLLNTSR
ncbi:MAG: hypothetical protein IJA31_09085 [Clostridia bacterium]|nr:hypothetical protein [Clostridia bacterium]